ncbi:hypothetical protein GCM10023350_12770 [Nocardioides endophyticus]|uniref:Uncharacterized protein n=1 Tax=Nocardioides endophyticus TaxID=1353775 RepID=A0ABP8YND6_9ACTN
MTMTRALRSLGVLATLLASAWVARAALARLNGTVVRDVRGAR